jgi:flavin-dependent dehydrogenase
VPAGPGWALVGDAGHYKDPALGQGIADAFLSAQLLTEVASRGAPLTEYHEQRDAAFAEMYPLTHEMASLAWSDDDLLDLFARYRAALANVRAFAQERSSISHA